ncbi:hypothetical protein B4U37_16100 [Sutcliffiella horikoshii]|uniref:N-formylglutamate amidohydrolase n=1 Tax=Sutcliffiella horikoshii TaxID=79883 RepID=A0ABM6KLV9_9BACI|nr:hypothetical protein [Sutcliffiella horikoshii]ART77479.1 hypothetical protein B4U37_16100 [Sutcliffiella horikoshii]
MNFNLWEKTFIEESFQGNQEGFHYIQGDLPIILSAPHSVTQQRKGKEKQGEFLTGPMVMHLQQQLNCHAIFKTKNLMDDANYNPKSTYRNFIKKIVDEHSINFLLDLHIMAPSRPYNIDLGTGRGKNIRHSQGPKIVNHIQKTLLAQGINDVLIDHIFTAGYPHTVSADVSKSCDIFCLQIEMNWRLLEGASDSVYFEKILTALETIIHYLASMEDYT